jgi:pyruvate/2-oxoglutarate/acetoin dehydrogenase E1 component
MKADLPKPLVSFGVKTEDVDPCTLVPLDKQLILDCLGKTELLVIVQEAVGNGRVASNVTAVVRAEAFRLPGCPDRVM